MPKLLPVNRWIAPLRPFLTPLGITPILLCLLILCLWIGIATPALAIDLDQGQQVFSLHCAGCHEGGGNIVRRGKTLKLKALEKNQVATLDAVIALVTNGKANMSAYADRLTPEEIENVAAYVLDQAQKNWK
ncbi:cytochrome c6 PetJ [Alkalinema sp. FACHB-956]|uniref:cytochrome c6 PetJ n=1 Tax=Alkalinema sp. FACHB-956 TaxID=2692768 RepID=UPI001689C8B6|nr:c-type cytochrome [Alkalinema sp. FACHB-956]MBD2329289.1 c-type cytochrome [Alkalinema sp. FACHB-956]